MHAPYRLKRYRFFEIGHDHYYYDDMATEEHINWLVQTSYLPLCQTVKDMINLSKGKFHCALSISGTMIDTRTTTQTIYPGWNWIGFPVDSEVSIEDALADFEPEYGDGIASYEGITEYIGTWTGDFMTFVPGHGYLYYSASATPKTLVFSTGTK